MAECFSSFLCHFARIGSALLCAALIAGAAPPRNGLAGSPPVFPSPTAWATRSIPLVPPLEYYGNEFQVAVDGDRVAYIYIPQQGLQQRCYAGEWQLRLFDLAQRTVRVVDRLPGRLHGVCQAYTTVSLSGTWLVSAIEHRSTTGDTISVQALNLQTGRRRLLHTWSLAPVAPTTVVFDWSVANGTVAWNKRSYRRDTFATSIWLQDLASGRETPVVVTPYFGLHDLRAWDVKGVSLSGNRVVWTRTTSHSANIMLYDRRTGRTVALTHDNISLVARISGDTVAWLVSKHLIPEGRVRILDLRSGTTTDMPGTGYNITIGDGLVSWFAAPPSPQPYTPLYFVRRHALRYYLPTPFEQTQDGHITDVQIFGRAVLVPTILHFSGGPPPPKRLFRLDIY